MVALNPQDGPMTARHHAWESRTVRWIKAKRSAAFFQWHSRANYPNSTDHLNADRTTKDQIWLTV